MTDISPSLHPGVPIPTFPALSVANRGDASSLEPADLSGRWTVLYFYPKDNTPGCSVEAQDFARLYDAFVAAGAQVLGVSRDGLKSHLNFCRKFDLPFALVVDTDEVLCGAFAVIKDKLMYGKPVRGIERSTFLIGPDATVRAVWRGVKVNGHAEVVLAELNRLQGEA